MSRENIAKTLKRLREQSGLTANQVGELVGKSGKTVNAWENNRGQPDAEVLIQLCDIYNVVDILAEFREDTSETAFAVSDKEKELVIAYRAQPYMQPAVDKLLGLSLKENIINSDDTNIIKIAARDGSFTETTITSDDIENINNLPDVDDI